MIRIKASPSHVSDRSAFTQSLSHSESMHTMLRCQLWSMQQSPLQHPAHLLRLWFPPEACQLDTTFLHRPATGSLPLHSIVITVLLTDRHGILQLPAPSDCCFYSWPSWRFGMKDTMRSGGVSTSATSRSCRCVHAIRSRYSRRASRDDRECFRLVDVRGVGRGVEDAIVTLGRGARWEVFEVIVQPALDGSHSMS
jgi:hypothetical protein